MIFLIIPGQKMTFNFRIASAITVNDTIARNLIESFLQLFSKCRSKNYFKKHRSTGEKRGFKKVTKKSY